MIIFKKKINSITVLPFGCVINTFELENNKIFKDILIYSGGIIVNIIFIILEILYFDNQLILKTNILILIFNILPIFPLDGGRILFFILCYFTRVKQVLKISAILSIILCNGILIYCFFFFNLNLLVISIYLIYINIYNLININVIYHNFLLNKHLNPNYYLNYKEIKVRQIGLVNNFFKGVNNYIDLGNKRFYEYELLNNKYKKNRS